MTLSLDFLDDRTYQAEIYTDAYDTGTNPNHLVKTEKLVQKTDSLLIQKQKGGGTSIHLSPLR